MDEEVNDPQPSPRSSTKTPARPGHQPDYEITPYRLVVYVVALAVLLGVSYYIGDKGFWVGFWRPNPTQSAPAGYLLVLTLPAAAWLLHRFCVRVGRGRLGRVGPAFAISLLLHFLLVFATGHQIGRAAGWVSYQRDQSNLDQIHRTIDHYTADLADLPRELKVLEPHYLPDLEPSDFDRRLFPRYTFLDEAATTASLRVWMVWLPGPDRQFDIKNGPQLKQALRAWRATGTRPAWLIERTYDPSNGIGLGSDMLTRPDFLR